ncbi:MAG: aminoglycoside adenylyltransferase [Anaerolineales bacterium]|nr:aminoglycoside 6-adenylyltransferase [Anaerolineae bacterium]PWB69169.1 MAG: aminoglycoside adenylyltransferase [Anaerolineales bacterium]
MRSEQEMLELILNFVKQDVNIRAVAMNGSRTNPNAKKDIFQDYDIACFVDDLTPYVRNDAIPKYFGEILILQEPENMQDPPPEEDGHYAYLMQFKDGNRIDLSFDRIERIRSVLDDSLTIVLLDKDDILGEVPPSSDRDYLPKKPTDKQFQDCCNEFWWVNPYAAKGLWRGELTYSKYMMDVVIREEQLMKMLTWYFGVKTDFKRSPGKFGKYIKSGVEPEIWLELEKTYCDANFENIWESLFCMGRLFRRMAIAVATEFGFQYPQQDDDNVSEYLMKIKNLPGDATTFQLKGNGISSI